jgi:hypothetical protein
MKMVPGAESVYIVYQLLIRHSSSWAVGVNKYGNENRNRDAQSIGRQ